MQFQNAKNGMNNDDGNAFQEKKRKCYSNKAQIKEIVLDTYS